MSKKSCFVIGRIGEDPSQERDHANTFLKYIVEPCDALRRFGYAKPVRADQIAKPGQITTQIIERLLNDDLVIADLTGHNPNVYYELSLRHAITKPVVQLVFGEMRQLPFDVHASRTIPFSFDVREVERARNELDLQINEIHNSGFQASNLIAEVATLTQIGKTGPLEMVDVLKAVQNVAADVRLLAGDVQMLKQRGAAFVSSPTGPSPGNAFISGSSEDMKLFGSLARAARAAFLEDGKLVAAGVGYSGPPGVPPQDPAG
jgi:hypothetical protein